MLTDAFVVLGLRQNLVVFTISQYEDATLDTAHELLNDYAAGSIAEHAAQHLLEFLLGFVEGGENEYTLTSAETIGLQYVRCL